MNAFLKNKNKIILFLIFFGAFFIGGDFAYAESSLVESALEIPFKFAGLVFTAAGVFFAWIVDPVNIINIVGNDVVYQVWTTVRDFVNMFFILVLLFSAFATIFQISKYNIKNILLTLVLMALLVNFSFPIARVIIDISNVIMYQFLNTMFNGSAESLSSTVGSLTHITTLLTPKLEGGNVIYLIMATIFLFILAMTMMIFSILLFIRIIVLAILVMLSPIGFVGNIFPAFNKYANDWWDALFKYSFNGPILVFFLALSLKMMEALNTQNAMIQSLTTIAGENVANGGTDPGTLASTVFVIMPIIILWTGLSVAQKTSVGGAAVVGAGKKWGKKLASSASGYNWGKRNFTAYKKERDERRAEMNKKSLGSTLGGRANDAQDRALHALGSESAGKRLEGRKFKGNREDIDKKAKEHVENGGTSESLAKELNRHFGSAAPTTRDEKVKQAAAATAYMRQDSDERKEHIRDSIKASGGIAGSDLEHIILQPNPHTAGSPEFVKFANKQLSLQRIAAKIQTSRGASEKEMREISSYVAKQMKSKVEAGAKAK